VAVLSLAFRANAQVPTNSCHSTRLRTVESRDRIPRTVAHVRLCLLLAKVGLAILAEGSRHVPRKHVLIYYFNQSAHKIAIFVWSLESESFCKTVALGADRHVTVCHNCRGHAISLIDP
jgi:hypothetical protein